ncbi:Rhodanese-like protein [Sporormia fimetaria CBS 119925]|uniref:Rhodanese-like protein n=1 Tax=Sporormia fimetaria CBS 119925 TaxID=1340428 RepID=A0A6A6VD54_9PLEO|nr:Rhodanese-like protein [Sporormia fimetaria CBS 119925]
MAAPVINRAMRAAYTRSFPTLRSLQHAAIPIRALSTTANRSQWSAAWSRNVTTRPVPAPCARSSKPAQRRCLTSDPASQDTPSRIYTFEEIKTLPSSTVLIDVREPSEHQAGCIPGTQMNIPVSSQPDALLLPAEEFEDRFGLEKPEAEDTLVFYCKAGVRSRAAATIAKRCGFKNVGEYPGSWNDWVGNGGEVEGGR